MQKPIQDLMQKEMTRKEFITTVGFGLASIAGLSTLLHLLGKKSPWDNAGTSFSYGGGPYGGQKSAKS